MHDRPTSGSIRAVAGVAALALVPFLLGACDTAPAAHGGAESAAGNASEGPEIVVYKSPTCGCCTAWEDHMREHGFQVTSVLRDDQLAVKAEHGVPGMLASCHTAVVDGYVIEGHVPADLVLRLLEERPDVIGLTVPGMPMGSPGMEGPRKDAYDVLTFTSEGQVSVFASR